MSIVGKLLEVFQCVDYGVSKIELFNLWLERDNTISISLIKDELLKALNEHDFDWVKLALEKKFVYAPFEVNSNKFDVDDLLILTDSFRWKDVVRADSFLSIDQREELKDQFREIGVQQFNNIYDLIDHEEFKWLPFEIKHAYKSSFGEMTYTNEDIVFYLKKIIWEYLFPKSLDSIRLNSLKEESLSLLKKYQINEGWVEMSSIVDSLISRYQDLDLYELSRIDWGNNIQHKSHYRNPFTLGFKRIAPKT